MLKINTMGPEPWRDRRHGAGEREYLVQVECCDKLTAWHHEKRDAADGSGDCGAYTLVLATTILECLQEKEMYRAISTNTAQK